MAARVPTPRTLELDGPTGSRRCAWHRGSATLPEFAVAAPRRGLCREHPAAPLPAAARDCLRPHPGARLPQWSDVRRERRRTRPPRRRPGCGVARRARGTPAHAIRGRLPGTRSCAAPGRRARRGGEHPGQGHQARLGLARCLPCRAWFGGRSDRSAGARRVPHAQQGGLLQDRRARRDLPRLPESDTGDSHGAARRMGRDAAVRGAAWCSTAARAGSPDCAGRAGG